MNSSQYYLFEASGDITAIAALLVSLGALAWTVYSGRRDSLRRHKDEYWYREVVGPNCVTPLVAFLGRWLEKLASIDGSSMTLKLSTQLYEEFCAEKTLLLDKFYVSKIFSNSFYDESCDVVDAVEDVFAEELGKAQINGSKKQIDVSRIRGELVDAVTVLLKKAAAIHDGPLKLTG